MQIEVGPDEQRPDVGAEKGHDLLKRHGLTSSIHRASASASRASIHTPGTPFSVARVRLDRTGRAALSSKLPHEHADRIVSNASAEKTAADHGQTFPQPRRHLSSAASSSAPVTSFPRIAGNGVPGLPEVASDLVRHGIEDLVQGRTLFRGRLHNRLRQGAPRDNGGNDERRPIFPHETGKGVVDARDVDYAVASGSWVRVSQPSRKQCCVSSRAARLT